MASYDYYFNDNGTPVRLRQAEFIRGTNTASGAALTGVTADGELYDGKHIYFRLAYAAAANATLNLTLADGTQTGAIPVFFNRSTRLSTHFGAGQIVGMTYLADQGRWQVDGDYTNMQGQYLCNYNTSYFRTSILAESLAVGDSTGYVQAVAGASFDISYPPLWVTTALAAGGTNYANTFIMHYDRNLTNVKSSFAGAARSIVYLVITLSGKTATIDSKIITDTLPTAEDGKLYLALGRLGNQSTGRNYFLLYPTHPVFYYKDGAIHEYAYIPSEYAKKAELAAVATSGSYNDLSDKPTIPAAVTVDAALSSTSTNPVQNKAVKAALDGLKDFAYVLLDNGAGGVVEAGSAGDVLNLVSGNNVTISEDGDSIRIDAEDTHHQAKTVIGASAAAKDNAATDNSKTYLNVVENGTVRSSHQIKGAGAVSVSADANGVLTISGTGNVDSATKAQQDGNGNVIADTYLPLSGGQMTGNIWTKTATNRAGFFGELLEDNETLRSGFNVANGAHFDAKSISAASNPGAFLATASDGTNTKSLLGRPDGTLTWGGSNVVRADNAMATIGGGAGTDYYFEVARYSTTGIRRYRNGLQICWGQSTCGTAVTFPKAYSSTPGVIVCTPIQATATSSYFIKVVSRSATAFTAYGANATTPTTGNTNLGYAWIAIGAWSA